MNNTNLANTAIASNVYLDKISAQNFENSTKIDKTEIYKIGDYIAETLNLYSFKNHISILDIGSGTGRTILNILDRFHQNNLKFNATCFDVSEYMLEQFKRALKRKNYLKGMVTYSNHDANKGLDGYTNYHLVFIVSVLQYLQNWRKFIKELTGHICPNGHLVLAELIGWYRLLDGSFDKVYSKENQLSVDFWREYFCKREKYGSWKPEIKFSNIKPVLSFLLKKEAFSLVQQHNFLWPNTICWSNVLSWLQHAPVSSLGSNMPSENRQTLNQIMYDFLQKRGIDINRPFSISWGFKLHILQKRK